MPILWYCSIVSIFAFLPKYKLLKLFQKKLLHVKQKYCFDVKEGSGEVSVCNEKFALHPSIHTSLGFSQAQDVETKKAEPKTPVFLSLNQDIVSSSR